MDLKEKNESNPRRHPWEISRAASILKILQQNSPETVYADIGAGDQYFSRLLSRLTNKAVYAVDINYPAAAWTGQPASQIVSCRDCRQIPLHSVDWVILMDVLEHLEDESPLLEDLLARLKDNGQLLITVPAQQFLFTPHDTFLGHYRRYSKKQLSALLKKHDLVITETFYAYTLLFIVRCCQLLMVKLKLLRQMNKGVGHWRWGANNIITKFLVGVLKVDFALNKTLAKGNLSLTGLSLCVLCRKKSV